MGATTPQEGTLPREEEEEVTLPKEATTLQEAMLRKVTHPQEEEEEEEDTTPVEGTPLSRAIIQGQAHHRDIQGVTGRLQDIQGAMVARGAMEGISNLVRAIHARLARTRCPFSS